jgi:phosphatidyl-myo-inositol dimannoside synthase
MKIAVVGPDFPPTTGGESEYAAHVALELHRRGHHVVVFTRRGNVGRDEGYAVQDVLEGRQTLDSVAVRRFDDFDVVHVINAAWSWMVKLGKPVFASIHGNDFISPNAVYGFDLKHRLCLPKGDRLDLWLSSKRTAFAMRKFLPQCRQIFANSEYTRQVFLQKFPSCESLVVKAGLGVSREYLNGALSHCSQSTTANLLTVCRLSERRKNVDLVLKALARLRPNFEFHYTVVGDGHLALELKKVAVDLGISDCVTFAGRVSDEDMFSYYQKAQLFVLPSGITERSFEGFGIVYLEANAMGVPTMAVRAGGAQEAVDEGKSGFFIEAPTVQLIEDGLRSFLEGKREFRSEDCRAFASRFTWLRVVDQFEQAYENELSCHA